MRLHVIAFQAPYPPVYGGVIDVYYRLQQLYQAGVEVILHCFYYPPGQAHPELERYCSKTYYYPRKTGWKSLCSIRPYIVQSRSDALLLQHLQEDNAPILFDGLHCCRYLNHLALTGRTKWVRMHNVEPEYYRKLATATTHPGHKVFFAVEALRLQWFEPILRHADCVLPISSQDADYLHTHYPNLTVRWMGAFHKQPTLPLTKGKGDWILYHGNFTVAENEKAAQYILQALAPRFSYPLIVAGTGTQRLQKLLTKPMPHVRFIEQPEEKELELLLQHARINLLITHQATGLKLKLLHALFYGGHCIANRLMLAGTTLASTCQAADTQEEQLHSIHTLYNQAWETQHEACRQQALQAYRNENAVQVLLQLLRESPSKVCTAK